MRGVRRVVEGKKEATGSREDLQLPLLRGKEIQALPVRGQLRN